MNTPQAGLQLDLVDEAAEPQPRPPEPSPPAGRLCRHCVLDTVLSIAVWIAIAVGIHKLIDGYGWSSWLLVAVAAACLAAAYLLVDLGYAAAAARRDRRVRRAFAKPPAGGDR